MTDEEREALEILECFEPDDLIECSIYLQAIEKIKNLIEKQSKIIDYILKSWKQDDIRSIVELKKYFEEIVRE